MAEMQELLEQLGSDDAGERTAAAEALASFGERAAEPLLRALEGGAPARRHGAALALGRLRDARALEPLLRALRDPAWFVRAAAADAVGAIGDARAVGGLTDALNDRQAPVRRAAVQALGAIGSARSVEALGRALGDEERSVRRAAVEALGAVGGTAAAAPLARALDDPSVRVPAVLALERLGAGARPALEALRALLHAEPDSAAARRLSQAIRRIESAPTTMRTELEAAPAPAGRGTELEAGDHPSKDPPPVVGWPGGYVPRR